MTTWLWLSVASASQWSRIPELDELAQRSRALVVGTVEAAESEPAPYGLSTRYEIRVSQTVRGPEQELVVIELPGGRWEGLTQQFVGVPLWEEGETVMVFVPPEGSRPSLAGVFTVRGDVLVDPVAGTGWGLDEVLRYCTGLTSSAPMSGSPSARGSPSTSTSTTSR
jgi:hypothetical protein